MRSASAVDLPNTAELAAFRAYLEGLSSRQAVEQYLAARRAPGQSSRAIVGSIRRRLIDLAVRHQRSDLVETLRAAPRSRRARSVPQVIEVLRTARTPAPTIVDELVRWLPPRVAAPLERAGIRTLADLAVRVVASDRWWRHVPSLGRGAASSVKAFFEEHPQLLRQARRSVVPIDGALRPWERLPTPRELDGSRGLFRAPRRSCVLAADNDYAAIQAWLSLHESEATRRSYRKEAERLVLWSIVERGKALSSLTTEDAVAYRAFLRRPTPRDRWVGPVVPRVSSSWRPFQGVLSARSVAYALQVVGAMFRWLIEQRYVLANPFAGVKVRGAARSVVIDTRRAFSEEEWSAIRAAVDSTEIGQRWSEPALERLRFLLDFSYATGLRAGELVGCVSGDVDRHADGTVWLEVRGKGGKALPVALPPLATSALSHYLIARGLPSRVERCDPKTALVAPLDREGRIGAGRLWRILKGYFAFVAEVQKDINPVLAERLRRASPHWIRHTHATHGLNRGVELAAMRDNLRHSSIAVTSTYLHVDNLSRANSLTNAFGNNAVKKAIDPSQAGR